MSHVECASRKRTEDPYAEWAECYPPRAHNLLMEVEQAAVLELLPAISGLAVLDAGCGTGRYTSILAEGGAMRVVSIDLSLAMLGRVARPYCVRGDLRSLPITDASFDLVVSGLAINDVPQLTPVFSEWGRVLKPGGIVVCSMLHPRGRELAWTRTFETRTGSHTLPAFWHTLDDCRVASVQAGLSVSAFVEPCLASSDRRRAREAVALVVRARRAVRR